MKRLRYVLWGLAAVAAAAAATAMWKPRPAPVETLAIESGPIQVQAVYEGALESREVRSIMSRLGGMAAIMDLIPDGSPVRQNDVLARFDASQYEKDALRLERDYALALADKESLVNAKLPLELTDLEMRLADAQQQSADEAQALKDNRDLLKEDLISEQEVKQQELKVVAAHKKEESLVQQLDLTRRYLHPAALDRAAKTLESGAQELAMAQKQLSNCVVRAPSDGIVAYKAVSIGGDYRTVRVGDNVYRNQIFMELPDMSNLVMRFDVPESELTHVPVGAAATVRPLAYPDVSLTGRVESVGSMAQSVVGKPGPRKYFNVRLRLLDTDPKLRTGMTVEARVNSYSNPKAVLIPRTAVRWEGGQPLCRVWDGRRATDRRLKLGMADDARFEVQDGVVPGERVMAR